MNIALIMAAGKGTRLGEETPKQFLNVNERSILSYSLETFNNSEEINAIYIVANSSYFSKIEEIALPYHKVLGLIEGGASRSESVYNGLKYLAMFASDNDIILIHDAARPLVNNTIILNNIYEAKLSGAVDTVLKENNSIIRSLDNKNVSSSLDRNEIYQSQTPQTFKFSLIYNAYQKHEHELDLFTDDISIAIKENLNVTLVNGSKNNFKITTKEDLDMFKALIGNK